MKSTTIETPQSLIDSIGAPALLMQADPRQVVTANKTACDLFSKKLSQIKGYRGGQVFNCIHSFTELGCGKDPNCEECKIKNAVIDTFAKSVSHNNIETILVIKENNEIFQYDMKVSTRKVDSYVTIIIEKYMKKA